MKIQRTSETTISPRAREELMYRQSVTFYNAERELRKPLGICNVSLFSIWESFIEVLNELDTVLDEKVFRQYPPISRWDKILVRRQEKLIADLMRYFDDCLSILCCFFPKQHPTLEEDRKKVAKLPVINAAMVAAKPYRDHIANTMNHIKHQQGALRGVMVFNETVAIPGYFVEHVNQKEILEPHPDVHPLYQEEHTAFSLFRDLRYNFFLVYAVSEIVADAISQIVAPTPNTLDDNSADEPIIKVASRIGKLPKWTFPNEIQQDFPEISLETINDVIHLVIEYPSVKTILPAFAGTFTVSVGWVGDGVTRSLGLPYYTS